MRRKGEGANPSSSEVPGGGRRRPRKCEEDGRRAVPLPPKYPRPSLTKPLDLDGGEPFSPPPVGVPKKKNQRSSVRQSRDRMDTTRDTMDTTAAIVMRQSTVFVTFATYHITHTRQSERPNILDFFTHQVLRTAHSPHHMPRHQTSEGTLSRKIHHTDDGEFPSVVSTSEETCITSTPKVSRETALTRTAEIEPPKSS